MGTPQAVKVVAADLQDPRQAAAVVALLDLLASDELSGATPLPAACRDRLGAEMASRDYLTAFLAYRAGEAVGCAVVQEGFSTFHCQSLLNLHDLVVSPAHRGRGIGTALLAKVEEFARRRGCYAVSLEVVAANYDAQALYAKLGYADSHTGMDVGATWFWVKRLG